MNVQDIKKQLKANGIAIPSKAKKVELEKLLKKALKASGTTVIPAAIAKLEDKANKVSYSDICTNITTMQRADTAASDGIKQLAWPMLMAKATGCVDDVIADAAKPLVGYFEHIAGRYSADEKNRLMSKSRVYMSRAVKLFNKQAEAGELESHGIKKGTKPLEGVKVSAKALPKTDGKQYAATIKEPEKDSKDSANDSDKDAVIEGVVFEVAIPKIAMNGTPLADSICDALLRNVPAFEGYTRKDVAEFLAAEVSD